MKFLCTIFIAAAVQAGDSVSVEYTTMNPCRQGGCLSPKFEKGYFIQLHDYNGNVPPDGYELWAPDGSFLYHINIVGPDGKPARVHDVAVDRDGTAVAAMWYGGVEVGLDGTLIGRWKLGPDSTSDPITHNVTRSRETPLDRIY